MTITAHIDTAELRWSWIQVDLNAIRNNIYETKRVIGRDCKILAVVKAAGYGHGSLQVAKTALNSGAAYLGVASVEEAVRLRKASINAPILVLSQPPIEAVDMMIDYEVMPSVYTPEFAIMYAEAADKKGKLAPFHLAINTGMNRIGVNYNEVVDFLKQVSFHRALQLEGTFTHFATADSIDTIDFNKQFERFKAIINYMKNNRINPGIVHCANSAAIFKHPETHFDMVRLGLAMYGHQPFPHIQQVPNLKPAMSIHARITDERVLAVGEGVGYGMEYRARGAVKICTLPIGYADGLRLSLSGKTYVLYKGQKFPLVGKICMDQCMFEIDMNSSIAQSQYNAQIGDEVVLIGKQFSPRGITENEITMEEIAKIADTNIYEILCGFGNRLPVVYK